MPETEDRHLGRPVPRKDGLDKVHGRVRYMDDVRPPGCLHAALITSPHAHARIMHIDTSATKTAPGVRAVVTGDDFPIL